MPSLSGFSLIIKTPSDAAIAKQTAKPADPDFSQWGGFTAKSLSLNATEIEVTNDLSSENRELLDGHGIRSFDININGFVQDEATFKNIEQSCLDQDLRWFQLDSQDNASGVGRRYTSKFKITSISYDGEVSGSVNCSMTLMSSGAITIA